MVKVISLIENTSKFHDLKPKHGLSLYIETSKHKVLFDVGPDKTFYCNALKKGVDLSKIDTVIISHGHNDHCGGLPHFLKINKIAKVYIKKEAFDVHLSKGNFLYHNIGISKLNIDKDRLIFVDDVYSIDDELKLFSNVTGRKYFSSMNACLFTKKNENKVQNDNFEHEQYLIVSEKGKDILFTGCSHNGIVNIVEKYEQNYCKKNNNLICVIGGFHLFNPITKEYEKEENILDFAKWICSRDESYFTCHCTGQKAFDLLKVNTNEKVSYLSCGESLLINTNDDEVEIYRN